MDIVCFFQNKNLTKSPKLNVAFGSGLTPKMMREIQRTDILEVTNRLAKKGIPCDFNDNKIIAWCSDKTVEIFEQLNKKYKLNLALPKGIYVEDFYRLNVENPNALGTCNMLPSKLRKNSNEITPSRVIFFNSSHYWENIDKIADDDYASGFSSTPHFLNFGLHEVAHSIHEDRVLNKLNAQTLARELDLFKNKKQVAEYQRKYGKEASKICDYAQTDPFEAIACDMPRVVISALNEETLMPTINPFIGSPYEELSFWKRVNISDYSDEERPLKEILRRFWNGKFN